VGHRNEALERTAVVRPADLVHRASRRLIRGTALVALTHVRATSFDDLAFRDRAAARIYHPGQLPPADRAVERPRSTFTTEDET
jgi:hypothetical protein